jgi:hypothetical protein
MLPAVEMSQPPSAEEQPIALKLKTLALVVSGAITLGMGYNSIIQKQNQQAEQIAALRDDVRQLAAKFERERDTRLSAR